MASDNHGCAQSPRPAKCHLATRYAKPHFARRVLTFLNTQGVRLLIWTIWSPDLLPIENICSTVAERLVHHPSSVKTIDEE
ncbi:hypothetical protein TNCV_4486531 [Trichonephila clavipes]|nr:hypothetical protein TNCV_4486531 [Trichonephila clavipes]